MNSSTLLFHQNLTSSVMEMPISILRSRTNEDSSFFYCQRMPVPKNQVSPTWIPPTHSERGSCFEAAAVCPCVWLEQDVPTGTRSAQLKWDSCRWTVAAYHCPRLEKERTWSSAAQKSSCVEAPFEIPLIRSLQEHFRFRLTIAAFCPQSERKEEFQPIWRIPSHWSSW